MLWHKSTSDDAHRLLEHAMTQLYAFPQDFPGYGATLNVAIDGAQYHGAVELRAPGQALVSLGTQAPPHVTHFVSSELQAMLAQRWPMPFAARDGRYAMTLDPTPHPLGVEVALLDDPLCSRYRIRDGQLTLIERVDDDQRCVVIVYRSITTASGQHLPTVYAANFYAVASGQHLQRVAFHDRYIDLYGLWLPWSRLAVATTALGTTRLSLALRAHRLLATLRLEEHSLLCGRSTSYR